MFAFLFKDKSTDTNCDADIEMAKLAMIDRIDIMLAHDTRRKLRCATFIPNAYQ